MFSAVLCTFAALILVPVLALQVPVGSTHHWKDENHQVISIGVEDPTEWNLNKPPNPNNTDHLVFETVHSLLQHWPNTRMRNGKRYPPLFDSV